MKITCVMIRVPQQRLHVTPIQKEQLQWQSESVISVRGSWPVSDELLPVTESMAKHASRYLCGIVGYGLRHFCNREVMLHGYADSDWAGSALYRKSTSGCCFSLGFAMISWLGRKLNSVWQFAEYIAASVAVRKAVWL